MEKKKLHWWLRYINCN